jgi:hypothetical protein
MTCVINLANTWLRVRIRHTYDHRVAASINTMKYLNGPDNGFSKCDDTSTCIATRAVHCVLLLVGLGLSYAQLDGSR